MPFRYLDKFTLIVPSFDAPEPSETPCDKVTCNCCDSDVYEFDASTVAESKITICDQCLEGMTVSDFRDNMLGGDVCEQSELEFASIKKSRFPSELMCETKQIFADYLFNLKNQ